MGVLIDYTNYRGERAIRHIELPAKLFLCQQRQDASYHPGRHVIGTYDIDKGREWRIFAMDSIHAWRDVQEGEDVEALRREMGLRHHREVAWELIVKAAHDYVNAGPPGTDQEKQAFAKLVGEMTLSGFFVRVQPSGSFAITSDPTQAQGVIGAAIEGGVALMDASSQAVQASPINLDREFERATLRSCNRHADCDQKPAGSSCCHDDCCEDCFGQ